jgi:ATP-dependent DNA helicase PIF1
MNYHTFVDSGIPIPTEVIKQCDLLKHEDKETHIDLLIENSKINKELRLKKGALVMCLANIDVEGGICNGSQGVVVGFTASSPIVQFLDGTVMPIGQKTYQHGDYPRLGVEQIPLRLAWAFTIHKSQGITLDIAEMDLGSKVFECGQSYVGLSRVRNLDGLYLSSFNPKKIKTNPTVIQFYNSIPEVPEVPVVSADFSRFACAADPTPTPDPNVKIVKLG